MRDVPEWVGSHDDQTLPPRVKVRIFQKFNGRCATCTLQIAGKLRPAYDHIIALTNGGEHKESNVQLLCISCHATKTRIDVAEKSVMYHKKAKNIGIDTKNKRPFPGSRKSKWKKMMNGRVITR